MFFVCDFRRCKNFPQLSFSKRCLFHFFGGSNVKRGSRLHATWRQHPKLRKKREDPDGTNHQQQNARRKNGCDEGWHAQRCYARARAQPHTHTHTATTRPLGGHKGKTKKCVFVCFFFFSCVSVCEKAGENEWATSREGAAAQKVWCRRGWSVPWRVWRDGGGMVEGWWKGRKKTDESKKKLGSVETATKPREEKRKLRFFLWCEREHV